MSKYIIVYIYTIKILLSVKNLKFKKRNNQPKMKGNKKSQIV